MSNPQHDRLPTLHVPVGDILARELDARGWSQGDFAAVLGRPTQFVSEIVNGKKEITRESAAQIGAALGHTPQYWLSLQDHHLLAKQADNAGTQARLDEVRRRARLNEKGPIQLLIKRGFLQDGPLDQLEQQVQDLFELASLDDEPAFAAAAKRANQDEGINTLQRAWVACVRKKARRLPPPRKYSKARLEKLAPSLATGLLSPAGFVDVPERFAETGVRLVYVEALPGAKIDGAAMLVDGYPVIGLSGRGKRLDKVLFCLLHEAAHVLLQHVDAGQLIVEDLDDKTTSETARERDANQQATQNAFPNGFPPVPHRVSAQWVEQTAAQLQVAPIVVVGQLQHRGRLDWRTTLAKNAPSVNEVLGAWT